jgi:hypothetical protein
LQGVRGVVALVLSFEIPRQQLLRGLLLLCTSLALSAGSGAHEAPSFVVTKRLLTVD